MRTKVILGCLAIAGLMFFPVAAGAEIIKFDNISAPCCYVDYPSNPGAQVFGSLTISGGVVMNNSGWSNLAPSAPNLYGTSDFIALGDGSFLPGSITGVVATPVQSFSLWLLNGYRESDFHVSFFDEFSNPLGSISMHRGPIRPPWPAWPPTSRYRRRSSSRSRLQAIRAPGISTSPSTIFDSTNRCRAFLSRSARCSCSAWAWSASALRIDDCGRRPAGDDSGPPSRWPSCCTTEFHAVVHWETS